MVESKPGNKFTWSPHSLFSHAITFTKDMGEGDWAKKYIQFIDRREKIVILPGTDVRLMHLANNIGRVARQLLSRKIWEKVIEPKNAFSLLTKEKRLWCFQGRMWGLYIQLITLAESDSMMRCWWWRRQLDVDSSMTLTIALNSAILESKIPTGTENLPRRWPWWFRSTPPILEGPDLPRE
jgi:hypothetical protein